MIDKSLLRDILKIIYEEKKKKGGSVLPETQTNLSQVKMVKEPIKNVGGSCEGGGKKSNPWMEHVKKVKAENPTLKYSEVLKKAKTTYTKVGGAVVTKTYPAQKTAKTAHNYETKIEEPVKAQNEIWNNYKQNKGLKKMDLKAEIKSSKGTKPKVTIVKPEKQTKPLQMRKPKATPRGVQSTVKLSIKNAKPTKSLAKEIGEEIKKFSKQQTPEEVLREARQYVPEREGQKIATTSYGSEEKYPLFGKGLVGFEKDLFKTISKETKDLSPAKAKTYARKYITDALKAKGWKPQEIKPIIQIALERIGNVVGGAIELPKSNIEHLLVGLEKSGVFDATKTTLKSMATKLADVVNDPKKYQQQRILTVEIPNIQTRYDKLKNVWDVKSNSWTNFRRNNHEIRMMNLKADITNRLNKLAGINMLTASKTV
jgi:hypothetical protein